MTRGRDTPPGAVEARSGAWTARVPWLAAGAFLLLLALHLRRGGGDTRVFWRAGQRLLAGAPLFPPGDGFWAYRYAPGTALLFTPLAPLPWRAAQVVWDAVLVTVVFAVVRHLVAQVKPAAGAAAAACLAVLRPSIEEAYGGQVNWVVLGLLLWCFAEEDAGRDVRAGLLLALAVGLKLAPALLALDWLLRRRWRALAGLASGAGLLVLASIVFYGPAGALAQHGAWAASLASASGVTTAAEANQSILGAATRLGAPRWIGLAIGAALTLWALARRSPEPRRSSILFLTALASPMGWIQNFVCALPAVFRLAARGRGAAVAVAAAGLVMLVPLYDIAGPRFEHMFFQASGMTWSMLALFLWASAIPAGDGPRCAGAPAAPPRGPAPQQVSS